MTKYCPKCGSPNEDIDSSCENCGKPLKTSLHDDFNKKLNEEKERKSRNKNILIIALVIIIIAISTSFAVFTILNNDATNQDISTNNSFPEQNQIQSQDQTSSQNQVQKNQNSSPTWHLIKSLHGDSNENSTNEQNISLNTNGKVKIVLSGMPIENHINNYVNGNIVTDTDTGNLVLNWASNGSTVLQSDSFEGGNGGTVTINLKYFNMDYWDLEMYDYY